MRDTPFTQTSRSRRGLTIAAGLAAGLCLGGSVIATSGSSAATKAVAKAGWVKSFQITEYYPVPESWFKGASVTTPGLPGKKSRVDWLYSATGMSMEGDGIGIDGKRYHIDNLGNSKWIAKNGSTASFGVGGNSAPYWRAKPSWRNKNKNVTFPLLSGGWSAGKATKTIAADSISFGSGASRKLSYYRSVAVDPSYIPLGSLVYVSAYATKANRDWGWMKADDTGGAIDGRHLDIYTPPPKTSADGGYSFGGQQIYIVPVKKLAAYLKSERTKDYDGLPLPPASLLGGL
jgi:3D (Asp-Asp-Asp) domain-containing protein